MNAIAAADVAPPAPPPRRRPRWRRRLLLGGLVLALLGFFVMARSTEYFDTLGGSARGARLARIRRSPNWRDGVFQNPVPTTVMAKGSCFGTARAWMAAHADLRGRFLMPIHWGAFDFGVHAWDEPIDTLLEGAPPAGATLLLPKLGQVVRLSEAPPPARWWK